MTDIANPDPDEATGSDEQPASAGASARAAGRRATVGPATLGPVEPPKAVEAVKLAPPPKGRSRPIGRAKAKKAPTKRTKAKPSLLRAATLPGGSADVVAKPAEPRPGIALADLLQSLHREVAAASKVAAETDGPSFSISEISFELNYAIAATPDNSIRLLIDREELEKSPNLPVQKMKLSMIDTDLAGLLSLPRIESKE